jgi:hypothetical protein
MPATQKRRRREIRDSHGTSSVTREQASDAARRIKNRREGEKNDRNAKNGADLEAAAPELKPSSAEAR